VSARSESKSAGQPDFLVIVSDDQRADALSAMPTVKHDLLAHGVDFANGFVSNALCCPSRTSILTGRYSHSTHVWTNRLPNGGFERFDDSSTLPVWLHDAGYTTALFGKYLNSYTHTAKTTQYVPPGWDEWMAFVNTQYFDYRLNVNGHLQYYGRAPSDYSTDVLANAAASYITNATGPLFMMFDPFAPHAPATPAPRYAGTFANLPRWDPTSYDEKDVSDKPQWVQHLQSFGPNEDQDIQDFRRRQYETLLSVDDAVGQLIDALQASGRLDNTFIIYLSDNGYEWGEHRWHSKQVPYEESIRVPFIIRYDPMAANDRVDKHLVVNIDIAPTIADLAGVRAPNVDGRSLVPLLSGRDPPWRSDFLLEHVPNDEVGPPAFCGIRTENETYVFYETGEQELYNLHRDPLELDNLAGDPAMASTVAAFHRRLEELCRPAPPGVDLDTPPPSEHHGKKKRGATEGSTEPSASSTPPSGGTGSGGKAGTGGSKHGQASHDGGGKASAAAAGQTEPVAPEPPLATIHVADDWVPKALGAAGIGLALLVGLTVIGLAGFGTTPRRAIVAWRGDPDVPSPPGESVEDGD